MPLSQHAVKFFSSIHNIRAYNIHGNDPKKRNHSIQYKSINSNYKKHILLQLDAQNQHNTASFSFTDSLHISYTWLLLTNAA